MRKEILKFRAWDGLNKKMTSWSINDLCNHCEETIEKPSAFDIWMQYTGLKDKNGKEIYEGDILENELKSNLLKVEFEDGEFKMFNGGNGYNIYKEIEFISVVGNIYENSNLLK